MAEGRGHSDDLSLNLRFNNKNFYHSLRALPGLRKVRKAAGAEAWLNREDSENWTINIFFYFLLPLK